MKMVKAYYMACNFGKTFALKWKETWNRVSFDFNSIGKKARMNFIFIFILLFVVNALDSIIHEPHHEKTCLMGF